MALPTRPRFRQGMGIGLNECRRNGYKVKEFYTELIMLHGYIGYIDVWDDTLRVFIFDNSEDADKAVKAAREIGFTSAGRLGEVLHISNAEIERPHLKHISGRKAFYAELFR